jgi:hypothetical protein
MSEKKKSKAGRKKIILPFAKIDAALEAGANGVQVAAMFNIHPETLYNYVKEHKKMDFSAYLMQKRESGNEKLLTAQYRQALQGDRGLLIWLGKQRLNQTDKKEVKQEFSGLNFKIVEDANGPGDN